MLKCNQLSATERTSMNRVHSNWFHDGRNGQEISRSHPFTFQKTHLYDDLPKLTFGDFEMLHRVDYLHLYVIISTLESQDWLNWARTQARNPRDVDELFAEHESLGVKRAQFEQGTKRNSFNNCWIVPCFYSTRGRRHAKFEQVKIQEKEHFYEAVFKKQNDPPYCEPSTSAINQFEEGMSAYPDPAEQPAILSSPTTNYLSITLPPEKSRRTKGDMTPGGLSLASQSSIATLTSMASDPEGGVPHKAESWWTTALQVSVPFFLAGVGTIGAGNVLGNAQCYPVFLHVKPLMTLVSSLIGLKGNLDMCLSSRLSTQANLGKMGSWKDVWKMVVGNLALVQIQATVAAVLVALFAVSVLAVQDGVFNFQHILLLTASSIATATTSCFVLDFALIFVIVLSRRMKINPDNIATPLAASIGDVVCVTLLSHIASGFYSVIDTMMWVPILVICLYLLLLPMWIYIAYNNSYTKPVLTSGWVPVLTALLISGCSGIILEHFSNENRGFVVFQPIINGIGGNLVSVQASRISTMLHQTSLLGIIPPHSKICVSPVAALFKGLPHANTARILIPLDIIGQTVFVFAADFINNSGKSTVGVEFVLTYLFVTVLQVMLLLYLAHFLIHLMWRLKIDPDNSAIPYLTSIGDLTGAGFLALAFIFLKSINKTYESRQTC